MKATSKGRTWSLRLLLVVWALLVTLTESGAATYAPQASARELREEALLLRSVGRRLLSGLWLGKCRAGREPLYNRGKTWNPATHTACQLCKQGYAKMKKGNFACTRCAANTYADHVGMSVCKDCLGASMTTNKARTACVCRDPVNYWYVPGSNSGECTYCMGGCASAACDPIVGCTLCSPGYQLNTDPTDPSWGTCGACSAGSYGLGGNGVDGSPEPCYNCPLGTWAPDSGSANCSSCDAHCLNPSSCDPQFGCTACVAGWAPTYDGSGACQACPAGTYSNDGDPQCTANSK